MLQEEIPRESTFQFSPLLKAPSCPTPISSRESGLVVEEGGVERRQNQDQIPARETLTQMDSGHEERA